MRTKTLPENKGPVLIGIGGAHSGAGKTKIGCRLLKALGHGWGAIKCTPTLIYTSVVSDPHILSQPEKDTSRYIEAGAGRALWVQAPKSDMSEPLEMALTRMDGMTGVIVEGNSAIELVKPDIVIFIVGEPGRFKPDSKAILDMAHVVVFTEVLSVDAPSGAGCFGADDEAGYLDCVMGAIRAREDSGRD